MLVTSHRRKDLVVTKVARLGHSGCWLFVEAGQNMSLVQKLGCGTVITSISMVPGSHSSIRAQSRPAISYLSPPDNLVPKKEKMNMKLPAFQSFLTWGVA